MSQSPLTLLILGIVWIISLIGGIQFIINGIKEKRKLQVNSRLGQVYNEAKYRLRLAAGLALILWVLSGVVWIATHS